MKKFLFTALACCIMPFAFAQNAELIKTIDKSIAEIQKIIKLSNMRIELKAATDKPFDPKDNLNFESYGVGNTSSKAALQAYFEKLYSRTTILAPYTFLTVKTDEPQLLKLLGKDAFYFMHNADKQPEFIPVKLIFNDGTEKIIGNDYFSPETVAKKYTVQKKEGNDTYDEVDTTRMSDIEKFVLEQRSAFSETFAVTTTKPVTSVQYRIALPVETPAIHYLQKVGDIIQTNNGNITLAGISGNTISFTYPSVLSKKMEVRGLYKDGRVLREKSANSFTTYTKEQQKSMDSLLLAMQEAKKMVQQSRIKTMAELETYLQEHTPYIILNEDDHSDEPGGNMQYAQKNITFSGPVDKLTILLTNGDSKQEQFDVTYTQNPDAEQKDYQVATDFKTEKNGIINNKGEWLVKPQYDDYFRMMNRYYFTDQIEDRENIYHFSPETKTLTKINYRLDDYEIYLDKYVKIEPRVNGLNGIADARTGEILLPMEYEYLNLKQDKYWIGKKENAKEGALTAGLKPMLPFTFNAVDYHDGFFYVKYDEGNKEDVYDEKGNNITNGKYFAIKYDYNDGRLLVETAHMVKPGYYDNSRYYFLDEKGNVAIDLNAKGYESANIFSDGVAAVKCKDNGLYGFINTQGDAVIPCQYNYVSFFGFYKRSHLAPVELKNGGHVLIDKKGNVVKRFATGWSTVSRTGGEDGKNHFLLVDGVWYDDFGNVVKEGK